MYRQLNHIIFFLDLTVVTLVIKINIIIIIIVIS